MVRKGSVPLFCGEEEFWKEEKEGILSTWVTITFELTLRQCFSTGVPQEQVRGAAKLSDTSRKSMLHAFKK